MWALCNGTDASYFDFFTSWKNQSEDQCDVVQSGWFFLVKVQQGDRPKSALWSPAGKYMGTFHGHLHPHIKQFCIGNVAFSIFVQKSKVQTNATWCNLAEYFLVKSQQGDVPKSAQWSPAGKYMGTCHGYLSSYFFSFCIEWGKPPKNWNFWPGIAKPRLAVIAQ